MLSSVAAQLLQREYYTHRGSLQPLNTLYLIIIFACKYLRMFLNNKKSHFGKRYASLLQYFFMHNLVVSIHFMYAAAA